MFAGHRAADWRRALARSSGSKFDKQHVVLIAFINETNCQYGAVCMDRSDGRRPLIMRGARQVGRPGSSATWRRAGASTSSRSTSSEAAPSRWFRSNAPADPRRAFPGPRPRHHPWEESPLPRRDPGRQCGPRQPALVSRANARPRGVAAGASPGFRSREHGPQVPVGRVTYLHVEPMGFPEFLWRMARIGYCGALVVVTGWPSVPCRP